MINSILEALRQPGSPFFNLTFSNGKYSTELRESYYSGCFPDKDFTFDVSNNKVLANIDASGTVKHLVIYRGCYSVDDIPGVWIAKDFSDSGPFAFSIRVGETVTRPADGATDFSTSLLDNLFPRVCFTTGGLKATILAYAPVSRDNTTRLRGLVYGILVENTSQSLVEGAVILPDVSPNDRDPFAMRDVSMATVEAGDNAQEAPFRLQQGESQWTAVLLYAPGDDGAVEAIRSKGSFQWLLETWDYYRSLLGRLTMPQDPLTAAIFERAVCLCLGAVGMDGNGAVIGSNWGTYPATRAIWMKDMYYSYLPFSMLNPTFFSEGMLWFFEHGIRPRGSRFEGGIVHSLSNSLSSVIMAGLYYETTGDKRFFLSHRDTYAAMKSIMQRVLETRKEGGPWLFPSTWISDAYSLGAYHTGSNITVWKAFSSLGRIAGEVFGEKRVMRSYQETADRIHAAIQKDMTVEGPFGKQYIEGISGVEADAKTRTTLPLSYYKKPFIDGGLQFLTDVMDGQNIDLMMHDGEESDTTLLSFYGFSEYDDPVFRNYLSFAMSPENPTYGEKCRGIRWGACSGATFPGYTTGFAGVVDAKTMSGERGFMTELKHLCDIDGSWWWWPYRLGAETGDVTRNFTCGKCGWAAGVFSTLFVTEIMGVRYDAPSKTLNLRPLSPSSDYRWERARVGSAVVTIAFTRHAGGAECQIENHNPHAITVNLSVPVDEERVYRVTSKGSRNLEIRPSQRFLGKPSIHYTCIVKAGESRSIEVH